MLSDEDLQKHIVNIESNVENIKTILEDIHQFLKTVIALQGQLPVLDESGTCHQCASTKVIAVNKERTCTKCNFKWVIVEKKKDEFGI